MPKAPAQIRRDVDQELARVQSRELSAARSRTIPHDDLQLALKNARRDPDGQVFPWLPGYPLVGGTVYYDGRLWTVAKKPRGDSGESSTALIHLWGQGHDDAASAERQDLRPVAWAEEHGWI